MNLINLNIGIRTKLMKYAKRSKYPSSRNETLRNRKGGWAEIKIDVEAATR